MSDQPEVASREKFTILVAGDVVVDHHIYEGERGSPTMDDHRGVSEVRQLGGAAGLERLTVEAIAELVRAQRLARARGTAEEAARQRPGVEVTVTTADLPVPAESWTVALGVTTPPEDPPCAHHAYAVWTPYPWPDKNRKPVWRASLLMGYGREDVGSAPASCSRHHTEPVLGDLAPRILLLDDAGFVFRHQEQKACWHLPTKGKTGPEWIVLKMSAPAAQGDLWHELMPRFADRLICVVSANELRQECVSVSRGLSWERTIEDLSDALLTSPALVGLLGCRHLVITFSADGALWLDRSLSGEIRATLICDAGRAEGEWAREIKGEAVGYLSCLVAAIARALVASAEPGGDGGCQDPDLGQAIAGGLNAMRDLLERGHGEVTKQVPSGYPASRLAGAIGTPSGTFSLLRLPWPLPAPGQADHGPRLMMVEVSQRAMSSPARPLLTGLARQVVLEGTAVLGRLPHAKFDALFTADRLEIEALRGIRQLMCGYRDQRNASKPLSIGVFGPPGAGKSFGVKQLAGAIFGKEAWLEFNLAQFGDTADLIGAFHQVRDRVLGGITPVVFWDEFDSKEYYWLQYLLAPMQDGRFQERHLNHAVGKCVFVFAGATSSTFQDFGPRETDADAFRQFKLRKGPDFHSRLDAYYNVLGPNPRTLPSRGNGPRWQRRPDPDDVSWPLRRALLIRALLKCGPHERLDFDPDLVDALLQVPVYKHGARSVEKLVTALRPVDGRPIRRSSLPPFDQLAMHVDPAAFDRILGKNVLFRRAEVVEALAEGIHEAWRNLASSEGSKVQGHLDKPYKQLGPMDKEDNRAAARRLPEILALAGLAIVKPKKPVRKGSPVEKVIREHLEHHLERLAEAEHDGWMQQRLKNGWRYGAVRMDTQKIHPALVPYCELSGVDKGKDRNSVRHFPEMVRLAGYEIRFLE